MIRKRKRLQGMYTVEAALVMSVVMMVLAALLIVILTVHDRGVISTYTRRMAGECCWNWVEMVHHRAGSDAGSQTEAAIRERWVPEMKDRLMLAQIRESSGFCDHSPLLQTYRVTWRTTADFPLPIRALGTFFSPQTICTEAVDVRIDARQWSYLHDLIR